MNIAAAGIYDIEVRVASAGAGGTFHIEVNGDEQQAVDRAEHRRLADVDDDSVKAGSHSARDRRSGGSSWIRTARRGRSGTSTTPNDGRRPASTLYGGWPLWLCLESSRSENFDEGGAGPGVFGYQFR